MAETLPRNLGDDVPSSDQRGVTPTADVVDAKGEKATR